MTQLNEIQIKEVVRDRYGELRQELSRLLLRHGLLRRQARRTLTRFCPCTRQTRPMDCRQRPWPRPRAAATLTRSGRSSPVRPSLDFGSGGGIDCFIAAKAVGEQGRVIGIDMTEDMVNLARGNAHETGAWQRRVPPVRDGEQATWESDTVDAIISNCVINLAPDKDLVFREAYRILRPGGRLMVSDLVKIDEIPQEEAEDTANWVSCLAGTEMKDMYLGRMETAGFTDVQVVSSAPWKEEGWQSSIHSMNISATKPV